MSLPYWLKNKSPKKIYIDKMKNILKDIRINSVCESAKCPNIGECFSNNMITFMILGDVCTRDCLFCGVKKGEVLPIDKEESLAISEAVCRLGIMHVVITSVTRDDLEDGGATQFINVIDELRKRKEKVVIEILTPDFKGDYNIIRKILDTKPDVFGHNIETVYRLYGKIRPNSDYYRSLDIIRFASDYSKEITIKSGLMVGLGETLEEIEEVFKDLSDNGCQVVTVGQYLRPSKEQVEVVEYISPEKFKKIKGLAENYRFKKVLAGPFIRSSYRAEEVLQR